jgi:ABC-2 type transport system permease protein
MRSVGYLLPPSYVFEGMRALINGEPFSVATLLLGAALAIGQVLLAGYCFAKVFRYTVRTGLLARYSAESVG